jgi:hypothetical protein
VTDLPGVLLLAFLAHCLLVAYLVRLQVTKGRPLLERVERVEALEPIEPSLFTSIETREAGK